MDGLVPLLPLAILRACTACGLGTWCLDLSGFSSILSPFSSTHGASRNMFRRDNDYQFYSGSTP